MKLAHGWMDGWIVALTSTMCNKYNLLSLVSPTFSMRQAAEPVQLIQEREL